MTLTRACFAENTANLHVPTVIRRDAPRSKTQSEESHEDQLA